MKKLKVLPPMQCDSGCGECCGPVPVTETEFQRIRRYIADHNVVPVEQGVTCPLFLGGSCAVYEVRPLPCRIFGHFDKMTCPHGYNANVDEREILRMVRANGKPTRWLHELFEGWSEQFQGEEQCAKRKQSLIRMSR